jgi:hypothetical protein
MGGNYVFSILNREKSPRKMSNSLNMAQNRVVMNFWRVFSKQESTSNQTANDNFHNESMGEKGWHVTDLPTIHL